jgi:hypothetical protein
MKVNTPSGWLDAIPTKVNTPGGWKDVVSVKVNTPGGWKPVWEAGPVAEPEALTELRWRQIGPAEIEFTAWGGSGTYFYDFDGDGKDTEASNYAEKVVVHTYKTTGYKTCTCMDIAGNANQQGVKVSVDLTVRTNWP